MTPIRQSATCRTSSARRLERNSQRDVSSRRSALTLGSGPDTGPFASPQVLLSGGFSGGNGEGMVGEIGDEFQVAAECLDVAGDGLDG